MECNLFTKEQLLQGHVVVDGASEQLIRIWLSSVIYHGLNTVHEDVMWGGYKYWLFDDKGVMMVSNKKPATKKLILWDIF